MPPAWSVVRNTEQNLVSRSCNAYRRWWRNPLSSPVCVAAHLLHPCLIRMSGNPGQADAATLQMNEEQHVVRHQTTPGKHLDREKVNAGQHRHMRLNEFLPRCR